jgi:hypothetical protein
MAALVKGFVRNTLIYRALLVIFLMGAFLIPWLWLVSVYTLKAFEDLIGRELNYGNSNKASP